MRTIEEYKEYTQQLEGEVKKWHDAFDASELMNRILVAENRELKEFDVIINDDYKTKCYMKADADKVIAELESENKFVKERLGQQEKAFKWHKVEVLLGKLTGDLPSRDLNRVYGRDFLVHYTVKYGNCISHGIAYSDYDEDEGFFELEENYTPVHWCEVPLPPIAEKFKPDKEAK